MMKRRDVVSARPTTVYFDTNFYIMLAEAKRDEVVDALVRLNLLNVRHVICPVVVLGELLKMATRPDADYRIFSRVCVLQIPPYKLTGAPPWASLLLTGEARRDLAARIHALQDGSTGGESWSFVADTASDRVDLASMLRGFGLNPEWAPTIQRWLDALRPFGARVATFLGKTSLPERIALGVSGSMYRFLERVSPEFYAHRMATWELRKSVLATDGRPLRVVTDQASRKEHRGLGNTRRDIDRMGHFVCHRDKIDFFQIDGPQMRLLKKKKPRHYLSEVGLADRCFTARSLEEAIEEIERLTKTL